MQAHDYNLVFGVDVQLGMEKADRLIYGDSLMTHAMVGEGNLFLMWIQNYYSFGSDFTVNAGSSCGYGFETGTTFSAEAFFKHNFGQHKFISGIF